MTFLSSEQIFPLPSAGVATQDKRSARLCASKHDNSGEGIKLHDNTKQYSKMKIRKPKRYPMNGPSMHIQRLMQSPRKNFKELSAWAKAHPEMRQETVALCKLEK